MTLRSLSIPLLCLTLTACSSAKKSPPADPAAQTVTLKKHDRVLFFGDSLTALAQESTGYVTVLRQDLYRRHPGMDLLVLAVATGGHTTDNLLERLDRDVLPQKPTVVFIQIGVNDAAQGFTEAKFKANLETLIARLRAAGARVVLCSLTSLGEKHDGTNRLDAKLDAFADVARAVAREQNVPLNDLRKAFTEHWKAHNPQNKEKDILTYDGNHFNAAGHRFVADRMLEKLR